MRFVRRRLYNKLVLVRSFHQSSSSSGRQKLSFLLVVFFLAVFGLIVLAEVLFVEGNRIVQQGQDAGFGTNGGILFGENKEVLNSTGSGEKRHIEESKLLKLRLVYILI